MQSLCFWRLAAQARHVLAVTPQPECCICPPCRPLLQQHLGAVLAGERPALTALLEALWVWCTGQQQGPWLRWAQQRAQAISLGGQGVSSVSVQASTSNRAAARHVRSSSTG